MTACKPICVCLKAAMTPIVSGSYNIYNKYLATWVIVFVILCTQEMNDQELSEIFILRTPTFLLQFIIKPNHLFPFVINTKIFCFLLDAQHYPPTFSSAWDLNPTIIEAMIKIWMCSQLWPLKWCVNYENKWKLYHFECCFEEIQSATEYREFFLISWW